MKGVVLGGGLGTRLYPLTKITNKHLLPLYNLPMIYYPIFTLVEAGINEVILVTGGNSAGDFLRLLGNGTQFGLKRLSYIYQEEEKGIAHAVSLTSEFIGNDKFVVILGDNILDGSISHAVEQFKHEKGAKVILKEVPNPSDYGVPVIEGKKIKKVIEKPKKPPTNYAVIGVYMYDTGVFKIIRNLKPSARGELEISDVNDWYARNGELTYEIFNGWWGDAGVSVDALLEVNNYVAKKKKENPHHWGLRDVRNRFGR
ncbi:NTP transferase domain-containing protein [candidate division WOR-3 bacterium]|nr:NTP transferase domain-containing protein [candidate division WOR-3 bacterium]